MQDPLNELHLPLTDLLALLWFVICWASYVAYAKRSAKRRNSLLATMYRWREHWVMAMLERDNRIVDSQVINGLVQKATFFASTTILILASSVALMGIGDEVNAVALRIPYIPYTPPALWELKAAVLAVIFVYAFFKFSWSIRQHSYSAVIMASVARPGQGDPDQSKDTALRLAHLSGLGARHFNDGIRAYYFALAELSWFLHPLIFAASTAWVLVVLYRREFHSRALAILNTPQEEGGYP